MRQDRLALCAKRSCRIGRVFLALMWPPTAPMARIGEVRSGRSGIFPIRRCRHFFGNDQDRLDEEIDIDLLPLV